MDARSREALASFLRHEIRTELAAELQQLQEVAARVELLEDGPNGTVRARERARLRRQQVVRLSRQGVTWRAIADRLQISKSTVRDDLAKARNGSDGG